MKRHFLLLTIFLAFGILNAQETYRFRTEQPQGFSIESSTSTVLSLHYSLSEISIANIDNGEAKGQEIILKGSFGSFAEGLPNLPFENRYIAVPKGATVSIEVKENATATLNDIDVLPAASLQGNGAAIASKLHKDMSIFGKDANFPTENVVIAQTTQIRGLDVAMLSVTPFRYNPVKKVLEVIYDMDIEVRFEGGNGQFGDARYRNPDWDGILRDLVINSDMLPEAHYYDLLNEAIQNRDEGCEYLIISPDDEAILAYADTLRQFRTKQGILTKVVTTTDCGGNDANAIKGYIQNAYEHWAIPPAAVMIFGGADTLIVGNHYYEISSGIPGFGLLFKGYDNGHSLTDYHYSSDNPYADMNGDSIPDLALSRLPAMNLNEYRTQVHKLIQYETNPPTQPNYYDQPIITSSYEYNKWFLITSQNLNGFYRNKLGRHPKNFYMLYKDTSNEIPLPDTAWSTDNNTPAVVDYFGPNGQNYIAQQPDTLSNWRDMYNNYYLLDALRQSSFLTIYRDHSSFDLWCSPWTYSYEIKDLESPEPTFVLSIGCDAALYSNVIFYESSDSYYYMGKEPMIYEFCKANTGGLGGIGAATVTHSHFNDILTWGIIDNFWPNYLPDMGTMTQPEFTRPAYSLVSGKLFFNQQAFMPNWWPQKITTTNNVFHYLGETYLNLYTEMPQQMAIDAETFTNGQSQYTITAEEGATICLSHGDDIIKVTHASGHPQNITLPQLPIGDRFFVTVTKQNRFRFEQEVTVLSPDQPYVYVKDFLVNSHDNNGLFDAGEIVDIDITLYNHSQIASDNGEITLICESPYAEVTQNSAHYRKINPEATITLERAFRIKLASNISDQSVLQFKVRFNENENTHEDAFNVTINAPVVKINPDIRLLTANEEPSTHISTEGTSYITFSLSNIGHSDANYLYTTLDIKAPFVDIETPSSTHQSLAPNEELTLTYKLNTTPNTVTGAWLKSQFNVQYGENRICLDTIIQYGGIFEDFETETLNPFFRWTNSGSHKWEYCSEDAYQGQFCFMANANTSSSSVLKAQLKTPYVEHRCKLSFYYKTDENDSIVFYNTTIGNGQHFSSKDWQYAEVDYNGSDHAFVWSYKQHDPNNAQAKIDDICFPPLHTAIAYAGDEMIACSVAPVELKNVYAYDCDAVLWATEGDGHFEDNSILNTIYFPGNQDMANRSVTLLLSAFGNDTVISSTQIQFLDEISLGNIVGDSVVNKYEQRLSHYSIEPQDGINYLWQLDPAEAGTIYSYGNAIDLVWNLHEGDAEVVLSVTAENGCDVEPITKTINLVGTSMMEFQQMNVEVYPNPSHGQVYIKADGNMHGKTVVEIYSIMGNCILQKTVSYMAKGEILSFDLRPFGSGMYLVRLSNNAEIVSRKVCVITN